MIRHREERRGCRVSGLRKSSLGFAGSLRAAFCDTSYGTIENSSENTSILWWCARVRTFVQFASFVTIRDLLVLILSRMARINEWHESSKSTEIPGFLDSATSYSAVKSRYMNPAVSVNPKDCRAVSYPLEYVIISGISILFFAIVMMTAGTMLTAAPLDVAATQQFNDVGNDISNKLIMFYLIVPEHGMMNTTLEMPQTIGGHGYTVRMSTNNTTDQTVTISADDLNVNISYTLNGIGASIPIDGETHSASGTHRLSFISTD